MRQVARKPDEHAPSLPETAGHLADRGLTAATETNAVASAQQDLWSPAILDTGRSAAELDRAYLEAVKAVRDAVRAARRRRVLVVSAVRAAVRAGIPQDRVRRDLGLSRPRASELHRAITLEDELVGAGVLPAPGVSISHLEALLPVPQADRLALISEIVEHQMTVSDLRRLVATHQGPPAVEARDVSAVRVHLGRFLRPGWESAVQELLRSVALLAADVPMGTATGETS